MVIDRIHGLQATTISLNDRFTIFAATAPIGRIGRPRRGGFFDSNNQKVMNRHSYSIGQNKRGAIHQRIGVPGLRRFGSESSLVGLYRSNSLSNVSQRSVKQGVSWRQSNNNLNRSASFSSLSQGYWRGQGFRRRGGRMGLLRGRMRIRGGRQQLIGRIGGRPGVLRGRGVWVQGVSRGRGQGGVRRQSSQGGVRMQGGVRGLGGARGRMQGGRGAQRGASRGGRGVVTRQGPKTTLPTKEELDLQLDQYMASTKSVLDKELDAYMKNAMEME